MNFRSAAAATLCIFSVGSVCAVENTIDLRAVKGTGVKVLENYSGKPNRVGVMETYTIDVPEFEQAVYYVSGWWPAGGNRVSPDILHDFSEIEEGGMFLLVKLVDGHYLAVLPTASRLAYTWFDSSAGNLVLKMGTHGTAAVTGDIPLYAWARAANPYEACNVAWRSAVDCNLIKGAVLMRHRKTYPEVFRYLGWCSWGHYKRSVSQRVQTLDR